jgi:hypothetical protein
MGLRVRSVCLWQVMACPLCMLVASYGVSALYAQVTACPRYAVRASGAAARHKVAGSKHASCLNMASILHHFRATLYNTYTARLSPANISPLITPAPANALQEERGLRIRLAF